MKSKRVDASVDRQIITGMVVSDKFLKTILTIYKPEYLISPFAITVAEWCVTYYGKYKKAPGKDIQDIFYAAQRNNEIDDAQMDTIEQFLQSLSDEYERNDKFNSDYLMDQAERLFRERSLKYLFEDGNAALANGDLEDAEVILSEYRRLERPVDQGINPLSDMEAYQKAFEAREEPLFRLPGALGEMLSPHFVRSGFVAFLGRAKIGKTWRLMDIAMRAVMARCNVAFFQTGDLTQDDYMIRQGVFLSKKSNDARYCQEIRVPVLDCLHNQMGQCKHGGNTLYPVIIDGELDTSDEMVSQHRPCTQCSRKDKALFKGAVWWAVRPKVNPLTWREAWRATKAWEKRHKAKRFKLKTYSNSSVNMEGIERQLDMWEEYDGFVPDVILIDYMDIMAPEDGRKEKRHQEDDRWRAARRIGQDRHCLVVTVTQTNREGFDLEESSVGVKHLGEDKRKADHVTAFFGLNQSIKEEELGIIRVSSMGISREGKSNRGQEVCVIQSLETGQPYIASYYKQKKGK